MLRASIHVRLFGKLVDGVIMKCDVLTGLYELQKGTPSCGKSERLL
jgi:hypothetical protein